MKKKFVKVGVVGLIRGKALANEVLENKNMKLCALCEKNKDRLDETKEYFEKEKNLKDILYFEDFCEFLKSDIDAVIIATDAVNHVEYVVKALDKGKHILSEIPAINTVEEAQILKEAVLSHPDLKYMIAENCCYWAFIEAWKKMYEEGRIGDVVYAEGEYLHATDYRDLKPYNKKNHWRGYNPAIKYITHSLGPLLYILDDKIKSVSCYESNVKYNPYNNKSQTGVALFETKKGVIIRILICFGAYVGFDHKFRIIGTKGTLENDNTKPLSEAHTFARLSEVPGSIDEKIDIPVTLKFPGEKEGGHNGTDSKMINEFSNCIINDTKPPFDVDFAIDISLPGILAHESAQKGNICIKVLNF